MQDLVGIVRREDEMEQALEGLAKLRERAEARAASPGNREYNPGWHTALDLHNLLTVSEAITRARSSARRAAARHFRDDFPDKDAGVRQGATSWSARAADGAMQLDARARSPRCRPSSKQIIEEMK